MLLKRSRTFSVSKYPIVKQITQIWSNDGWCYIPELKQRRQFLDTEHGFLLDIENYDGIIPFPLYVESLEYRTSERVPQSWVETGEWGSELYEMLPSSHST
jgi:hypothetical protein